MQREQSPAGNAGGAFPAAQKNRHWSVPMPVFYDEIVSSSCKLVAIRPSGRWATADPPARNWPAGHPIGLTGLERIRDPRVCLVSGYLYKKDLRSSVVTASFGVCRGNCRSPIVTVRQTGYRKNHTTFPPACNPFIAARLGTNLGRGGTGSSVGTSNLSFAYISFVSDKKKRNTGELSLLLSGNAVCFICNPQEGTGACGKDLGHRLCQPSELSPARRLTCTWDSPLSLFFLCVQCTPPLLICQYRTGIFLSFSIFCLICTTPFPSIRQKSPRQRRGLQDISGKGSAAGRPRGEAHQIRKNSATSTTRQLNTAT